MGIRETRRAELSGLIGAFATISVGADVCLLLATDASDLPVDALLLKYPLALACGWLAVHARACVQRAAEDCARDLQD